MAEAALEEDDVDDADDDDVDEGAADVADDDDEDDDDAVVSSELLLAPLLLLASRERMAGLFGGLDTAGCGNTGRPGSIITSVPRRFRFFEVAGLIFEYGEYIGEGN